MGATGAPNFFIFSFSFTATEGGVSYADAPTGAPQFFFKLFSPPPKAAVAPMGAAGALTGAPTAPRPRRAREIPPKAGVREFKITS